MSNAKSSTMSFQQKAKVLQKLYDFGVKTEKELQALEVEKILQIPNITISDLIIITELQKHTKSNRLYSYLNECVTEFKKEPPERDGE